ncbi:MAG TPA: hypothetical protein VHZ09_14505 [Acidobacteriaceae bacterium]|jgi:predicted SnoaL-like aldol condensation-catalyzing enzyme|nr:hypothetical protein [Acidobacteriaceae bacterium]
MNLTKAARAAAITRSIETRERWPLASFDSRKYIQHNLNIADGLAPILKFMDGLPPARTRSTVVRAFEDGEYSFLHADYELGDWGAMVGFEVHRWENGRIVEHWDNLCRTPSSTNPSGRSLVDGETEAAELEKTEENRRLVREFADAILVGNHLDGADKFFLKGKLLQHSPHYGDGVRAFREQWKLWKESEGLDYQHVHKLLGQGNFFLVMSEGRFEGQPTGFFDLYRVAAGHIAEHWDVFETIPPRDRWANDNGKF